MFGCKGESFHDIEKRGIATMFSSLLMIQFYLKSKQSTRVSKVYKALGVIIWYMRFVQATHAMPSQESSIFSFVCHNSRSLWPVKTHNKGIIFHESFYGFASGTSKYPWILTQHNICSTLGYKLESSIMIWAWFSDIYLKYVEVLEGLMFVITVVLHWIISSRVFVGNWYDSATVGEVRISSV